MVGQVNTTRLITAFGFVYDDHILIFTSHDNINFGKIIKH